MTTEDYKKISDTLPKQPGVYRFRDKDEEILYVGKAKNLKNRLASYFGEKKHQAYKTRVLVKNADHFDYTIVDTENDALLLENTLIKKFQPRYNVMLKDGKSYAYICIKNERFPRVFFTRRVYKDGSTYLGPYTSKFRANEIFELIKQLFPLRTCKFNLSEENINAGKFKVCLEYHIKNCLGPCENHEEEESYNKKITQIKNILKGKFKPVKDYIKQEMQIHADNLEFEMAEQYREKLSYFENFHSKSTVVSATISDVDVFTIHDYEDSAYVNYLKVVNGMLINTDTLELKKNLNTEHADLLRYAIPHIRTKFNSIAPEVVLPFNVEGLEDDIKITVPQRAEKKKLLELSNKNITYFILQLKKQALNKIKKQTSAERILKTMKEDLQMDVVPFHIECFDNSNIQGTNPVASCVVFKNAKPSKKDYRKFNIKTVEGPDDFASMEEVVRRRYTRLKNENQDLPQLVIIDGGKGQLSSAYKIMKELGLEKKITLIGIAKRLEEIYFPEDSIPLYINKKSESLKVIQMARNEAHRFAINFHRDQRSKNFIGSQLTEIKGIGKKTADTLLKAFGSVTKIKEAADEELLTHVSAGIIKKLRDGLS